MNQKLMLALGILMLFFTQSIQSQIIKKSADEPAFPIGLGIGFKANTMGYGGEVVAAITPKLHARLGFTTFTFKQDVSELQDVVDGEIDLTLGSVSLLANYHLARLFFLSGGFLLNKTEVRAVGTPTEGFSVGYLEVSPDQIGTMDLGLTPGNPISPYLGIGLGRSLSKNRVLSFAVEMGVVFSGSPKVDFAATGMLTPTASEEQRIILEENLASFAYFPMLNFQLSFRIL